MFTALWIIGIALIVLGLIGTVIPTLPGTVFIFFGALSIAYAGEFQQIGYLTLTLLFSLMMLAQVFEFVTGPAKAKQAGASKAATLGAFLGGIFGIFLGFIGILVGPIVGAILGELYSQRDLIKAQKVGLATLWGTLLGVALKVAVGVSMLGLLLLAAII